MKTKLHAAMGTLVLLWALVGVVAGLLCLIIGDMPTVTAIALVMRRGVILMVAALVGVAISGGVLAGKRQDPPLLAKKRRMPMIIGVAVLVLLPADFYLSAKAQAGNFDALFDGVQGAALIANAALACLLSLNLRDGLRLTGRIAPPAAAGAAATGQQGGMIQKRDNGPLLALNIARLVGSDGGECPQKPVQALCRCGASRNKPFCDGSHAAINFVDTPSADRTPDGVLVYAGKELTIHYNRLVCSHAGECGARLKPVFDSHRDPWIIPDEGAVDAIIAVVKACPSGALRYSLPGGEPRHVVDGQAGITIEKDGPYRVCQIPFDGARSDTGVSADKYVLCRCGASRNKPFCDGSHANIGWREDAPAGT